MPIDPVAAIPSSTHRLPAARRAYTREVAVAEQLTRLADVPDARLLAAIRAREETPGARLSEETLVALCRRLRVAGASDDAWEIAILLADRVKRHVANALRLWRLDRDKEGSIDVVDEIMTGMYTSVLDSSEASEFWEIRFWVAFERIVLNVVRRRRRELDQLVTLRGADNDDGDPDEGVHESRAERRDALSRSPGLADPVAGAMVADALARLTQPVRTAYILKHVAGMAEEPGPRTGGAVTIAAVLGVSGRSVRNYLRRAERELEAWRSGEKARR